MTGAGNNAVFLSYASQDAEAARRICEALRASGVEAWFDQSELVGGDAWDAKIRGQIGSCALFVPVISANTQARREGYFRLEWRVAVERMRQMDDNLPFLLPVVIDDTRDTDAFVPERFREVQWTRLIGGETGKAFCDRVKKLLGGELGVRTSSSASGSRAGETPALPGAARARWGAWLGLSIAGVLVAGVLTISRPWQRVPAPAPAAPSATTTASSPARQLTTKARALFENPAYTTDDLALAEDLCRDAIKLDSNDAEVWAVAAQLSSEFIGGRTDLSAERFEEARTRAERAVKLAPASTEARFAKATYLRRVGGTSRVEAEKILRELSVEIPQDPRVLIALGKVIWGNIGSGGRNLERAEEALAWFGRAAAIPAGRAEALGESGWLLFNLGRYAETEAAIDESLRLRPSKSAAQTKVRVSLARGDLPAARAALNLIPADLLRSDAGASLAALVWLHSRQPEKCFEALSVIRRDYLSSDNFLGPTDVLRGHAYRQAEKSQAARSAWQAALQVVEKRLAERPRVEELLFNRANLLALLGEREAGASALRLFEETFLNPAELRLDVIAVHALLEPTDPVIDRLERLFADRPAAMLKTDFRFEMLRGNPRFEALLTRIARGKPEVDVGNPSDQKSVAVLAFENRSSEKDSEYFSDGVSDELINVLGRVAGLKVVAPTSSFAFRGNKAASAQEIARTLGVTHLVAGSVQQVSGKARVTARLIRADTSEQLWGDSFETDVKDIFSAQVTTARAIAEAMTLRLNAGAPMASLNPEAVKLYLQGRQEWGLRTVETMRRAEDLFTRAIALEPKFARAHSGLVDVWVNLGQNNDSLGLFGERDSVEMRRVVERARLAVALDPDSAEAQASLGGVLTEAWQPVEARRALERALELNPNYATAHHWLGRALLKDGRAAEAIASLRRACELDPLSSRMADNLGISLWFVGRGHEGLGEIDRALRLKPDSEQAQAQRAMVLASLGRREEAIAQAREVVQRGGSRVMHAVCALAVAGRQEEAARVFDSLPRARALSRRAHALGALGRWDECLAALHPETMVPATAEQMLFHAVFDPIRNDPRFVAMLETLRLSEAHARAQAWRAANPPEKADTKK